MTSSLITRLKGPLVFVFAGIALTACGADEDSYAYYQGRPVRIARSAAFVAPSPYVVDSNPYSRRPDLAARTTPEAPSVRAEPRRPAPRRVEPSVARTEPSVARYERPARVRRAAPVEPAEQGKAAYDPAGAGRSSGGGGGGGGGW